MNKKQIVLVIIITAVVVWTADLLVGNYLSARLATSSFARKFNLFNPQAPIVVTNRETIRVNNSSDVVETAESSKSKISTVVYYDNSRIVPTGDAINWTSDGYLVSTKASFAVAGKVYAVITQNGDVFPVEATFADPSSNLVIIKTSAQGLPVLDPADSRDLRIGQQFVGLSDSVGNKQARFVTGFIQRIPSDLSGLVMESDLVARTIGIQSVAALPTSSVILNLSGRMIGVWDGQYVVSVEDVRLLVNNFLSDQKQIVRPSLGFSYQLLSQSESKILQTVPGAKVMGLASGKAAAIAGLKVGDVITQWDSQDITVDTNFDSILRAIKPTQSIRITVNRDGEVVGLVIVAGKF